MGNILAVCTILGLSNCEGEILKQYISSKVDIIEPAGSDTFVVTKLGNKEVTARFHSETDVQIGSKVKFSFDLEKVSYFDPKNGQRIN